MFDCYGIIEEKWRLLASFGYVVSNGRLDKISSRSLLHREDRDEAQIKKKFGRV
jgi:hypothetical protein